MTKHFRHLDNFGRLLQALKPLRVKLLTLIENEASNSRILGRRVHDSDFAIPWNYRPIAGCTINVRLVRSCQCIKS
jgi:hypothetical protein